MSTRIVSILKSPWKPASLRTRLITLLLIVIVPVLAIDLYLAYSWIRSRYELALNGNKEMAEGIALAFNAFIQDVSRTEEIMGYILPVKGNSAGAADSILAHSARNYKSVERFLLIGDDGAVLAGSRADKGGKERRKNFLFCLPPDTAAGRTCIGPLRDSLLDGKPGFIIARRVRSPTNGRTAVVSAFIDPSALGELALNVDREEGGTFAIFDNRGIPVYAEAASPLTDTIRRAWLRNDPLLERALSGKRTSGTFISPIDGKRRIAARVPIGASGWVAGAAQPLDRVIFPLALDLLLGFLSTIVIAAGALALGLLGIGSITRALRQLRLHAERYSQGDFRFAAHPSGIVDFDLLGNEFGRMGALLRERDERIQARTRELERSNNELEQFAYVASHDLQEPLRTIAGYLQLIERRYKGKLDADADTFITFAVQAAHRLHILINDLLAFSRLGTRAKPFGSVSMEEVLRDVLDSIQKAVETSGARVTAAPMPSVIGDDNQLKQLFLNLIGNAIKFRREEVPPAVHIDAHKQNNEWIFSVRDNGIGIEATYFEKIFLAFKRLHTQEKYPGTGIGLAICRKIVERHGGRIWVESTPGKGSTFFFTLPERRPASS